MSQLPPKAAALLEAARQQHDPSEGERARTRAALFATLSLPTVEAEPTFERGGEGANHAPVGTPATSSFAGVGAKLIFVATLALGGAGLWALSPAASRRSESLRPPLATPSVVTRVQPSGLTRPFEAKATPAPLAAPDPAVRAPAEVAPPPEAALSSRRQLAHHRRTLAARGESEASSTSIAAASAPSAGHEAATSPAAPSAPATSSAETPAAPATQPSAIAELVLMRRALNELNAGRPEAALRTLAEHRASYPSGALTSEREGLSALALCANGQLEAGQRQKAVFLSKYENSPLATRLKGACNGAER